MDRHFLYLVLRVISLLFSYKGIKSTNNIDDMEGISPMTFTSYKGIRQNSVTAYIRPIQYQR